MVIFVNTQRPYDYSLQEEKRNYITRKYSVEQHSGDQFKKYRDSTKQIIICFCHYY